MGNSLGNSNVKTLYDSNEVASSGAKSAGKIKVNKNTHDFSGKFLNLPKEEDKEDFFEMGK